MAEAVKYAFAYRGQETGRGRHQASDLYPHLTPLVSGRGAWWLECVGIKLPYARKRGLFEMAYISTTVSKRCKPRQIHSVPGIPSRLRPKWPPTTPTILIACFMVGGVSGGSVSFV